MRTVQRLDECYQKAKVIEFDDRDKFILFSDVHRGDNSISDDFARNQNMYQAALRYYYDQNYTYIELGDGDELWEHARFEHIASAHHDVFMLLRQFHREKRMYRLFGNHDMILKNTNWVKRNLMYFEDDYQEVETDLFEGIQIYESLVLKYRKTGDEFLLVHGHQGDFVNDQLWFPSMLSMRYFWRFLHVVGFRNPSSPAKNRVKRHKIERIFSKWIYQRKKAIICGHTHRAKLAKSVDLPYFNTGCCVQPRVIYGIEIAEGNLTLVQWKVEADYNGVLRTVRKVIQGPRDIEHFLFFKNYKKWQQMYFKGHRRMKADTSLWGKVKKLLD
ncbi:serine/threonine protein phosphatase [Clostridiales bacterium COT073_COT-073]|nr:serine/threonine protein phosphatase [Clostridiales bacterium COT073_COT-073]